MTTAARPVVLIVVLATVGVAALAITLLSLQPKPAGTDQRERPIWSGPIRPELGRLPVQPIRRPEDGTGFTWIDGRDAGIGIVDIVGVETNPEGQAWRIKLAERPPRAAGLDPAKTLISYGLVFETTGDGIGDYIVGINNDAPKRGDLRVWVTDVASGRTEEQIGPPYGFPIEFSHPDEVQGQQPGAPIGLLFTFLGGSAPAGLTGSSPFYAWSSVTAADEVIAWDYAPDASWLLRQEVGG